MKCRLKVAARVRNPAYSIKAARAAALAGERYEPRRELAVQPGYVIDHPKAWIHCCPGMLNAQPIAEPADQECADKVREFMLLKRPAAIAQIRSLYEQLDKIEDADEKRHVIAQAKAYGLVPGFEDQNANLLSTLPQDTPDDETPDDETPDDETPDDETPVGDLMFADVSDEDTSDDENTSGDN